jgi:hypothetical protein
MKNFKKNLTTFGIVIMLLFGFSAQAQDLSKLSTDENFINFLKDELKFSENANMELVDELVGEQKTIEDNLDSYLKAFNTNKSQYIAHLETQRKRIQIINKLFNIESLKTNELSYYTHESILQIAIVHDGVTVSYGNNCGARLALAIAEHTAIAYLAHQACLPLDLFGAPGVGCHLAVAVIQTAAGIGAVLDYNECMDK